MSDNTIDHDDESLADEQWGEWWCPPEPERLACRQCGRPWDEPRLSPDGVCPLCQADLEER